MTAFAALTMPMVSVSLVVLALMSVLAGSAQATLSDPKGREAAIITLLVTASGVTLFDLGAPVSGCTGLGFVGWWRGVLVPRGAR